MTNVFILKKLTINQPPFRKLGNIEINFSQRITLIAGHNGIGKSTILALVANGSGLTGAEHSSYTSKTYQGNLNEIIYLDYDSEFDEPKTQKKALPNPLLEYSLNGGVLKKRCALTKRTVPSDKGDRLEVRVVPRNLSLQKASIPHSDMLVGASAKVPIPTIYLGMTRMLPVGESNPDLVESRLDVEMHADDADFIANFINDVIGIGAAKGLAKSITTQEIKGTTKSSKHPTYSHSPKSVSLGQDSLSAIATALASFKKLNREWEEYPGGVLVIDELDAGFHPHAQRKLIKGIRNAAKLNKIQVIATTHSLSMIEAVHPENNIVEGKGEYTDSVVYICDTANPNIATDYTLQDIRNDMNLVAPSPIAKIITPTLKIYLEDAEADFFLKRLLTPKLKRMAKAACGANLKAIPISVGCDNLQGLQKFDKHFKQVLIVVDADASIKKGKGSPTNVVKLPGGRSSSGQGYSPERTIYEFVKQLAETKADYEKARAALRKQKVTTDHLHEYLLDGDVNITKRESAKKWMKARLETISNWGLVDLWLAEHPEQVATFENELVEAAVKTARLLR